MIEHMLDVLPNLFLGLQAQPRGNLRDDVLVQIGLLQTFDEVLDIDLLALRFASIRKHPSIT